mmetsp:Transcript_2292/g.5124  ORF Transcript_2292/g.5124 Transcript_2292/m.5124 type:complete len:346 (+) Transcript_2292:80-1117(+)
MTHCRKRTALQGASILARAISEHGLHRAQYAKNDQGDACNVLLPIGLRLDHQVRDGRQYESGNGGGQRASDGHCHHQVLREGCDDQRDDDYQASRDGVVQDTLAEALHPSVQRHHLHDVGEEEDNANGDHASIPEDRRLREVEVDDLASAFTVAEVPTECEEGVEEPTDGVGNGHHLVEVPRLLHVVVDDDADGKASECEGRDAEPSAEVAARAPECGRVVAQRPVVGFARGLHDEGKEHDHVGRQARVREVADTGQCLHGGERDQHQPDHHQHLQPLSFQDEALHANGDGVHVTDNRGELRGSNAHRAHELHRPTHQAADDVVEETQSFPRRLRHGRAGRRGGC